MNIYNLTFSCDVYVCVHVEIYIYTRLRLPFRKGTRIFNISFSSFPSIFLHSLLPVFPLLSFLPCNRIGIYKYLQPKELTSYTYTYIPYSNSKSFEKSSHPIFVFNHGEQNPGAKIRQLDSRSSEQFTVPYIVTTRNSIKKFFPSG